MYSKHYELISNFKTRLLPLCNHYNKKFNALFSASPLHVYALPPPKKSKYRHTVARNTIVKLSSCSNTRMTMKLQCFFEIIILLFEHTKNFKTRHGLGQGFSTGSIGPPREPRDINLEATSARFINGDYPLCCSHTSANLTATPLRIILQFVEQSQRSLSAFSAHSQSIRCAFAAQSP